MAALGEWLRQIIVVVLIAAFIDLLLPNRSMQRYVKLVVSLFILMTILSPVLQFLGGNANLRMVAATVEGWDISGARLPSSGAGAAGGGTIPALGELLSEAQELARQRNERSLQLLEQRLEAMIADYVRDQHGVREAEVSAGISLDEEGLPVIRSIAIRIGAGSGSKEKKSAGSPSGGMEPIEPLHIPPVKIEPVQIGKQDEAEGALAADSPLLARQEEPALPGSAREIAASVARAWGIPVSRVSVNVSDGT